MKFYKYLLPLLLIGGSQPIAAQTDTLGYRILRIVLPDTSYIDYTFGGLCVKRSGSYDYPAFANNPADTNSPGYLVSANFYSNGTSDTITIGREVVFDDQFTPQVDTGDFSDSAAMAIWADVWWSKEVHPNSGSFSSTSDMKFIIELYRANDHSLLESYDTALCGLNMSGNLRYTTTNNTPNRIKVALPYSSTNDSVYLKVTVEKNLPGQILAYETYQVDNSWWPSDNIIHCGFRQEGCDSIYAFKLGQSAPYLGKGIILGVTTPVPNPFDRRLHFLVNTDNNDAAIGIELNDVLGARAYVSVIHLIEGWNTIDVNLPSLLRGIYFLRISDGKHSQSFKVIH